MIALLNTLLLSPWVSEATAASPFRVEILPVQMTVGEPAHVNVTFVVPAGFHLYQDMMSVEPKPLEGLTFSTPVFPHGHLIADPADPTQMREVFDTTVQVTVPVTARTSGIYTTDFTVRMQGCKATLCYMPQTESIGVQLVASEATQPLLPSKMP